LVRVIERELERVLNGYEGVIEIDQQGVFRIIRGIHCNGVGPIRQITVSRQIHAVKLRAGLCLGRKFVELAGKPFLIHGYLAAGSADLGKIDGHPGQAVGLVCRRACTGVTLPLGASYR